MKKVASILIAGMVLQGCSTMSTETKYTIGIGTPEPYDSVKCLSHDEMISYGWTVIDTTFDGTYYYDSVVYAKDDKVITGCSPVSFLGGVGSLWKAEDYREDKTYRENRLKKRMEIQKQIEAENLAKIRG
jgi:hypothetical protein